MPDLQEPETNPRKSERQPPQARTKPPCTTMIFTQLYRCLSQNIFENAGITGIAILPPVCSTRASNAASRLSPACETQLRSHASTNMLVAACGLWAPEKLGILFHKGLRGQFYECTNSADCWRLKGMFDRPVVHPISAQPDPSENESRSWGLREAEPVHKLVPGMLSGEACHDLWASPPELGWCGSPT